jgi:hypothetical protein
MNNFDLSVASLTLIGVEMSSTALSAISGPLSSHTRQRFPSFQVQCRVTLDRAFRRSRSIVESHSTAISAVPDPLSRNTRQRFPPLQFQCRVTHDSDFRRFRSNVESHWTGLSAVPGPMSSLTRQHFPLFQVQCRVSLDSTFHCSNSNVELISIFLLFMNLFIGSWNCEEYRCFGKLIWIRVLYFIRIIWTA